MVFAACLAAAVAAAAHQPTADAVIAEVGGPAGRAAGVVAAVRDPTEPRLLVVQVGEAWAALPAERRRTLAEAWRAHWRAAVPGGIVGVVDAASGRPAVNYDARGAARLSPPGPP
jgi:hypothetical protein